MKRQVEHSFIKSNAHKTRWFAVWHWVLTQDEVLNGLGEKANSKAFNTEAEARGFLESLTNG